MILHIINCVVHHMFRKSVQVPKIIEFRFFSKILHLLGIQDESALNSTNLLQVNPSSEKLQELAGSYVRREGRRRGKVGKRRSRHEGEECKMVALRECLDAVLLYDVYQVSLYVSHSINLCVFCLTM